MARGSGMKKASINAAAAAWRNGISISIGGEALKVSAAAKNMA